MCTTHSRGRPGDWWSIASGWLPSGTKSQWPQRRHRQSVGAGGPLGVSWPVFMVPSQRATRRMPWGQPRELHGGRTRSQALQPVGGRASSHPVLVYGGCSPLPRPRRVFTPANPGGRRASDERNVVAVHCLRGRRCCPAGRETAHDADDGRREGKGAGRLGRQRDPSPVHAGRELGGVDTRRAGVGMRYG